MKTPFNKAGPFDEYDRNARLKPAFIAAAPIALLLAGFGAKYSTALGMIAGLLSAVGLTYLVAQFGRDFGKLKEPALFSLWGGKPTTLKLRHRDGRLSPHTLNRYHKAASFLTGRKLPTKAEEEADPTNADSVYESVGDCLREKTRNKKMFPLIFKELVSYGFRRNLWGLKPIGLVISVACSTIQFGYIALQLAEHKQPTELAQIVLGINLFLAACWCLIIKSEWVRLPADAYADRLLAACELLGSNRVVSEESEKRANRK